MNRYSSQLDDYIIQTNRQMSPLQFKLYYLVLICLQILKLLKIQKADLTNHSLQRAFIQNWTGSWDLPSLFISTSIHRKQDRQLGLALPLYIYFYLQKIGQVVGSYPFSIYLPLFIENRTGSWVIPSLYISTSIQRKQDRQLGKTLPLYLQLYSQKIGQVGSYPPCISLPQKIGQVVYSYPPSIYLPLFI